MEVIRIKKTASGPPPPPRVAYSRSSVLLSGSPGARSLRTSWSASLVCGRLPRSAAFFVSGKLPPGVWRRRWHREAAHAASCLMWLCPYCGQKNHAALTETLLIADRQTDRQADRRTFNFHLIKAEVAVNCGWSCCCCCTADFQSKGKHCRDIVKIWLRWFFFFFCAEHTSVTRNQ